MRSVFSAFVFASVCLYTLQDVTAQVNNSQYNVQSQTNPTGQTQNNGYISTRQPGNNVNNLSNSYQSTGQSQSNVYQNNGQNLGSGSQYQTPGATDDSYSAGGQPTMVPLQCTQGYMPITEDELIAMSNDAQNGGDPSGAVSSGMGGGSTAGYGGGSSYGNGPNGVSPQLSARSLPNPGTGVGSYQTGNLQTAQTNQNTQYGNNANTQHNGNPQYGNNGNPQYSNTGSAPYNGNSQYGDNGYSQYGDNGNSQSTMAPAQAICAGNDDRSSGLCDTTTCTGAATCKMCQQIIIIDANSPTQTDPNIIQQVNCVGNYFKAGPNDQDQSSMCTDASQNMYTCKGGCIGQMTCGSCISREDPALQDGNSGQATGYQSTQTANFQNGANQNGLAQNATTQTGYGQNGQNGANQNGLTQNATTQTGYGQNGQNGAAIAGSVVDPQTGLPVIN